MVTFKLCGYLSVTGKPELIVNISLSPSKHGAVNSNQFAVSDVCDQPVEQQHIEIVFGFVSLQQK